MDGGIKVFLDIKEAIAYAKIFGGWIFQGAMLVVWYDASIWTLTEIVKNCDGSGRIDTWGGFERRLETYVV